MAYYKHQYIVANFPAPFSTLESAKNEVLIGFTKNEAKKYLRGEAIYHYIGGHLHSETPIKVDDDGNISFGKTFKV